MNQRLIEALDALEEGDWDGAHEIAQNEPGADGSWLHAHLHRVEGDLPNAGYWYRRAGRTPYDKSFEAERAEMRAALSG
jgi:hypothetical protein